MKIKGKCPIMQQLAATRKTWEVNPVTRVKQSKKRYNRKEGKAVFL